MDSFGPASHVERASAAARSRRALVRGAHCERETKCRRRPILRSRCPCPPSPSRRAVAAAAAAREGLPPRLQPAAGTTLHSSPSLGPTTTPCSPCSSH
ncbi:hypothetical protein HPB50_024216 [Hyalomma asiaticum]|uniref:Uncharacterized protein n=1 Tax=Hyalomma asiaticum TaxID=266040 RepID=A0ACB7SQR7_HYAAI|nr:hypothetical protein HPB50_024216 [Hyalomma asiaticum]